MYPVHSLLTWWLPIWRVCTHPVKVLMRWLKCTQGPPASTQGWWGQLSKLLGPLSLDHVPWHRICWPVWRTAFSGRRHPSLVRDMGNAPLPAGTLRWGWHLQSSESFLPSFMAQCLIMTSSHCGNVGAWPSKKSLTVDIPVMIKSYP